MMEVTRFIGVPDFNVTVPPGQGVYNWYNGWQRDRNHYEPMAAHTKALLNHVFCAANRDLADLLSSLADGKEVLQPSHGYACVT